MWHFGSTPPGTSMVFLWESYYDLNDADPRKTGTLPSLCSKGTPEAMPDLYLGRPETAPPYPQDRVHEYTFSSHTEHWGQHALKLSVRPVPSALYESKFNMWLGSMPTLNFCHPMPGHL